MFFVLILLLQLHDVAALMIQHLVVKVPWTSTTTTTSSTCRLCRSSSTHRWSKSTTSSPFPSTTTSLGVAAASASSSSSDRQQQQQDVEKEDEDAQQRKNILTNLFKISQHIQNPQLYSTDWFDTGDTSSCYYDPATNQLKTIGSKPISTGDIISLLPIHAIGMVTPVSSSTSSSREWMVYDSSRKDDIEYFVGSKKANSKTLSPQLTTTSTSSKNDKKQKQKKKKEKDEKRGGSGSGFGGGNTKTDITAKKKSYRYYVPPPPLQPTSSLDDGNPIIFCDVNPNRNELRSGWIGHLAIPEATTTTPAAVNLSNCRIVPIASPICALVATQDITKPGTVLKCPPTMSTSSVASSSFLDDKELLNFVHTKYSKSINELQEYMNMAYTPATSTAATDSSTTTTTDGSSAPTDEASNPESPRNDEPSSLSSSSSAAATTAKVAEEVENDDEQQDLPSTSPQFEPLKYPFYQIPKENLPDNMITLHTDPDVLSISNFLSDEECDRLVQKAKPHLIPCVTKHPITGVIEQDPYRTSRNTNIPQNEVPSIVNKISKLVNTTPDKLEIFQVLQYTSGQYFARHTDGFNGPTTSCGFENSARLVTIFVYLNDVGENGGGETSFPQLNNGNGLLIKPTKGTCIIHFPTTTGYEEDFRTEHEGMKVSERSISSTTTEDEGNEKWLLVTWVWMHPRNDESIYSEKYLPQLDSNII